MSASTDKRCSERMAADGLTPPKPCELCGNGPCRVEPPRSEPATLPYHELHAQHAELLAMLRILVAADKCGVLDNEMFNRAERLIERVDPSFAEGEA